MKDSLRPLTSLLRENRRLRVVAVVLIAAIAGAIVGAVAGGGDGGPTRIPEAARGQPLQRTSFLARMIPPKPERSKPRGPQVPRSIADLARRLPLERKVAQLFLVGFRGRDLNAVVYQQLRRFDLGGIVIDRQNYPGVQLLGQMAGQALLVSQQKRHVPPWVMAPQEGGEFNAFRDLPPSEAPSDITSIASARAQARRTGRTLRALGITGLLAPVVDVELSEDPALGPRAYSDDPGEVASFAAATVRAYNDAGMFTAAGHFPGLGSASQPTEEGPATVGLSLDELRRRDLAPFFAAFRAGAPGVLLSHALYSMNDFTRPASLSKRIVTGLLRRELRFRGVAITDDLADPPITALSSVPDAAVAAIKAGADMVYISGAPGDQQAAYVAVLQAVRRGKISRRRINEALFRILVAKRRFWLIR